MGPVSWWEKALAMMDAPPSDVPAPPIWMQSLVRQSSVRVGWVDMRFW